LRSGGVFGKDKFHEDFVTGSAGAITSVTKWPLICLQ
jgi:hypothetical protein